jgi:hypothetical protein
MYLYIDYINIIIILSLSHYSYYYYYYYYYPIYTKKNIQKLIYAIYKKEKIYKN